MTLPAIVPSPTYALATLPPAVTTLGEAAVFAWGEFFAGRPNRHTRLAYERAVREFLIWLEPMEISLRQVTPGLIGRYFEEHGRSVPTKKLTLAALRSFFDTMVMRHVIILNPALSVRAERHQVVEGMTPEITAAQARQLLDSIRNDTIVGLRDKSIIAVLIFTAARAGAVASLRRKDLIHDGTQYALRFAEKGGKKREIPVRHDLQLLILDYLSTSGMTGALPDSPLFRSALGRTDQLNEHCLSVTDIGRMVKRRLRDAGLPTRLSSHSFRVGTVTNR